MHSVGELKIGKNHVTVSDDNIVTVEVIGIQTDETAIAHENYFYNLFTQRKEKVRFLIDLNNCGKQSSIARQTLKKIIDDERTEKMALIATRPLLRTITTFIVRPVNKKKIAFFRSKNEGIKWLQSG